MQQAIPYSSGRVTWLGPAASASVSVSSSSVSTAAAAAAAAAAGEKGGAAAAAGAVVAWRRTVAESAAAVVGRRGCCMSHVVRRLLQGLGVNPTVCDVDDAAADAAALAEEFAKIGAAEVSLPAVFIGGKLVGGLDRLMALHISGELVPILKQAGALWL